MIVQKAETIMVSRECCDSYGCGRQVPHGGFFRSHTLPPQYAKRPEFAGWISILSVDSEGTPTEKIYCPDHHP